MTTSNAHSFLLAARSSHLERVRTYLNEGVDVNTHNAGGLHALHLAAKEGHRHVVEELLNRGALVDAATNKGNTALHVACLSGVLPVVKILIKRGANVNAQSEGGFTPLYMAAQGNHEHVVTILLNHGADKNLATTNGALPLTVAKQQGSNRVVFVLKEHDAKHCDNGSQHSSVSTPSSSNQMASIPPGQFQELKQLMNNISLENKKINDRLESMETRLASIEYNLRLPPPPIDNISDSDLGFSFQVTGSDSDGHEVCGPRD